MKRTSARRQTSGRRRTASLSILPPVVGAAVRAAEPRLDGIPPAFLTAYAAMPKMMAALLGQGADCEHYTLIDELSGLDEAERFAEANPNIHKNTNTADYDRYHSLARVVAILRESDPDHVTDMKVPIADAGFYVGMAFMAYVLTSGGAR